MRWQFCRWKDSNQGCSTFLQEAESGLLIQPDLEYPGISRRSDRRQESGLPRVPVERENTRILQRQVLQTANLLAVGRPKIDLPILAR